jgi:hypothetical protein
MARAASAAPDLKSDPPIRNLLRSKNGLDNGGHFRRLQKAAAKAQSTPAKKARKKAAVKKAAVKAPTAKKAAVKTARAAAQAATEAAAQ